MGWLRVGVGVVVVAATIATLNILVFGAFGGGGGHAASEPIFGVAGVRSHVNCGMLRSSAPLEADMYLAAALERLCQSPMGRDVVTAQVWPGFENNYRRVYGLQRGGAAAQWLRGDRDRGAPPGWVDRAFVNYFGDVRGGTHWNSSALLFRSVHEFSEYPIVSFFVTDSRNPDAGFFTEIGRPPLAPGEEVELVDDNSITPERYPNLVIFHVLSLPAAGVPRNVGFNFNKPRAILLSRVLHGLQVDSDSLVYKNADRLFDRIESLEAGDPATANFPVAPVHWMTRDPESDDFPHHPEWKYNVYPSRRSMRWVHAHPSWTFRALRFVGRWLTGAVYQDKEVAVDLMKGDLRSDERVLNMLYWKSGFDRQWCKYDMYAGAWRHFFTQSLSGMQSCCNLSDNKWYPRGMPIVFATVHGVKNSTDGAELVKNMRRHQHEDLPWLYWRGAFYENAYQLPDDYTSRCIF